MSYKPFHILGAIVQSAFWLFWVIIRSIIRFVSYELFGWDLKNKKRVMNFNDTRGNVRGRDVVRDARRS